MKKLIYLISTYLCAFSLGLFLFNMILPAEISNHKLQIARPVDHPKEDKHFVILVMSYNNSGYAEKNIRSILAQNYDNYRVIYIDDASKDDTFDKVTQLIKGHEERFTLIRNAKNQGAMANHWFAVQSCEDSEIVVIVDGDDSFAHPHVLETLNRYYANEDLWVGYSSHIEYPDCRQAICSKPHLKTTLRDQKARELEWQSSHLRSFYAGLFKRVKLEDLIHTSRFFTATYDLACMFPMLEMAKEHAYFIPEKLYIYNLGNPLCDYKVRQEEQRFYDRLVRSKPIYRALKEKPDHPSQVSADCDLIVFSYDRPIQLYAFLDSVETYIKGLNHITVIYRASDQRYLDSYEKVKERFPNAEYALQPERFAAPSFKPMLMERLCRRTTAPYLLFAVDDIIVKDEIDLKECILAKERTQALGFYLRLGTHTDLCYTENIEQGIPPLIPISEHIYAWQFSAGKGDWNYPNSVDMTLFKTEDVIERLSNIKFTNPANLEGKWAVKANHEAIGLCFDTSKIVNLPLNVVSTTYANRHMQLYTPLELLKKFEAGYKIDIAPLHQIANRSAHMEYEPEFRRIAE